MSKYGNIRTEVEGIVFASRREAQRYQELRLLEAVGKISDLKCQVKYPLHTHRWRADGNMTDEQVICFYIADFTYYPKGHSTYLHPVVEDVKGVRTPMYRLKRRWLLAEYGIEIQEV